MPPELPSWVPAILTALIGGWVTIQAAKKPRSTEQGELIDDLRQERSNAQGELKALREEVEQLREVTRKARDEAYRVQDAARLQISMSAAYIYGLRAHIIQRLPPPPPEIPEELVPYLQPEKN